MSLLKGSDGGGGDWEYKMIIYALVCVIIVPLLFSLMLPSSATSVWEDEIKDIEQTYYLQSGVNATREINVWTLTGIYTPYEGSSYGYTSDGWLYGDRVESNTPAQYSNNAFWAGESFTVIRNPANGLYYYSSAPSNQSDIVPATQSESGKWDFTNATVYSNITMDAAHVSDVFMSSGGRSEQGGHYYYQYTGYRYAFQPLSNFTTTKEGVTYDVNASTTSLSLVWYQYASNGGIAGQLTISGADSGLSYLNAADIVKAYNSSNFSAVFDMYFGNLPMHLRINISPAAIAAGMSVSDAWSGGYWSTMVYSDQDASSASTSANYEFSPDNLMNTVIALFTFHIAEDYNIDGWEGTIASLIFTLPLYACLIVFALRHAYLWIAVALIAAIQAFSFW